MAAALASAAATPALAHSVPGDPDPGRTLYVLPGLLASTGFRACCAEDRDGGFIDLGIEISAHRFVPASGGTILTQLGYGGLVQAQLGGIPLVDHPSAREVGTSFRLAVGAEGTFGPLGAQAGVMTRMGSETYGTAVGPFGGLFVSLGIFSVGMQVDVPLASAGGEGRMPVLVTMPVTLKWLFPVELGPRAP